MDRGKFVHLHVHTEYSLLDGLSKIKKLIAHIKEQGMDSVAITDHGVMYGAIEFYKAATNEGIKPIIGMEGYLSNINHTLRIERSKMKNWHVTLLAKNNDGYKNLMKLTSIAHTEGFYYRPRFDFETLAKYSKGLICLSGCGASELADSLHTKDYKKAKLIVDKYVNVFGDDYYLEIQRHEYDKFAKETTAAEIKRDLLEQAELESLRNEGIIKLSREYGIPLVASNDAHYINREDAAAQDALVCIATGKNISDVKRLRFVDAPSYHLANYDEMQRLFPDLPDSIENTVKIAKKCDIEITIGKFFFPKVEVPTGKSAKDYLKEEALAGLKKRYKKIEKVHRDRLNYELSVIEEKGYSPYFLIYYDMARWARERHVPINVRGSVAGSITTYALGITTVDPIRFNLPFERFLNPYRPSAPDIDLDIADDMREEILSYLVKKYGKEKVAQICTFGRMLARGSVRDTARVLGYPYDTGDKIAKLIPMGSQGFPMTIERALEENPELSDLYKSDNDAKRIIDLARQIEGNARHVSVHAAGVVISPKELTDFTPLQLEPSGKKIITQYEMWSCEDVGLVKLDVLGIRNLSILRESVFLVKEATGKIVDLTKIPLDDKKTFEMLARGETMGVFQLSGSGMTRYLVELEPEKIEDIMMMIALFRPGPMENIDEYIARKKGAKPVTYYHPKMEKFLDKSLGVLVYQDDLLYTALELAGYNWEEVDKFRKAVGKKIPEEMAKQHVRFVEGCVEKSGMSKKEAEGLWNLFEPFQGYGFNKAHSASYGMVAYQTAYMKANYPVEYMTALLTAESNDKDKISSAINECRRMGIRVLPPDINESQVGFIVINDAKSLNGKAIRFGLSAIKNVGEAAISSILEARKDGNFTSFSDFLARVDGRKVNKRVLESLIKVGAMKEFGNRASLLSSIDDLRAKIRSKSSDNRQQDLFSVGELRDDTLLKSTAQLITDLPEFSEEELKGLEKQLLGFSLSAKPLSELIEKLSLYRSHRIDEMTDSELIGKNDNGIFRIACVVSEVRVVTTRKTGAKMAFVKVTDETGSMEAVVFPKIFRETEDVWFELNAVLITGKVDVRDDGTFILVNEVDTNETIKSKKGSVNITIPGSATKEILLTLKDVFRENPGNNKVSLYFEKNGKTYDLPYGIEWNIDISKKISQILNTNKLP